MASSHYDDSQRSRHGLGVNDTQWLSFEPSYTESAFPTYLATRDSAEISNDQSALSGSWDTTTSLTQTQTHSTERTADFPNQIFQTTTATTSCGSLSDQTPFPPTNQHCAGFDWVESNHIAIAPFFPGQLEHRSTETSFDSLPPARAQCDPLQQQEQPPLEAHAITPHTEEGSVPQFPNPPQIHDPFHTGSSGCELSTAYQTSTAKAWPNPQITLSDADSPLQAKPQELSPLPNEDAFHCMKLPDSNANFEPVVLVVPDTDTARTEWLENCNPAPKPQPKSDGQYLQPSSWLDDAGDDVDNDIRRPASSEPYADALHYRKVRRRSELTPCDDDDTSIQSPREREKELQREAKIKEVERWRTILPATGLLSPDDTGSIHKSHRRSKSMGDFVHAQGEKEPTIARPNSPILQVPSAEPQQTTTDVYQEDDASIPEGPLPHQWMTSPARRNAARLPPTSANAMQWFESLSQETASLSLAATWGSRRLSDSEIGSIRGRNLASLVALDQTSREQRRTALTKRDNLLKGLHNTALKFKRRASHTKRKLSVSHRHANETHDGEQLNHSDENICNRKDSSHSDHHSSDKSEHQVDENNGHRIAPVVGKVKRLSVHLDPRRRSRSNSGLFPLITDLGGPPVAMLPAIFPKQGADRGDQSAASQPEGPTRKDEELTSQKISSSYPPLTLQPTNSSPQISEGEPAEEFEIEQGDDPQTDENRGQESLLFDDLFEPTFQSFKDKILRLNPMMQELAPFLADRLAHEQVRRYNFLLALRRQHHISSKQGKCLSGHFCFAQGGSAKPIRNESSQQYPESSFNCSKNDETPVIYAETLPPMVPSPPVNQFPVRFECKFCFEVKTFQKPSDWTKHVHGDLQPFTCTFECPEPKSFKRKADWIRHENERHRHLEWWSCDRQDCEHKCYRRDNFHQHLVREHRLCEPQGWRSLKNRSNMVDQKAGDNMNEINRLISSCYRQSTSAPQDEKCRFCGQNFPEWKKLSTHISKHLLNIAMPILHLLERLDHDPQTLDHAKSSAACQEAETQDTPDVNNGAVPPPKCSLASDQIPASKEDLTEFNALHTTGYDSSAVHELPTQVVVEPMRYCNSPDLMPQAMDQNWLDVPENFSDTYSLPNVANQTANSSGHWNASMTESLEGVAFTQPQQQPSTAFASATPEYDFLNFNNYTGDQILGLPFQQSPTWYEAPQDQSPEAGFSHDLMPSS